MVNTRNNDLIETISNSLRSTNLQHLDISFNEILDMYNAGELDISPDFQRLFRWSEGQQSRFIESLILEMPVPPIFVIEEEDGKYLLIDGLQRISSYLHMRGRLQADHLDPPVKEENFLTFSDCDIITDLNELTYNDLPTALQIRLKRAFIRMEVIRKETDYRFKYHMFKRLNTGGDALSFQQLRNCTIRMLDAKLPDYIIELSQVEDFRVCTSGLTLEQKLSSFDQELVLRFFAFKNIRHKFKHDVADFMTDYMEEVADPDNETKFNYDTERSQFNKTFQILKTSLGEYSFSSSNKDKTKLNRGFLVYHYEAITIGLQCVLDLLNADDQSQMETLKEVLKSIKLDEEFISITTGGGKNSPGPLKKRIEFVEGKLNNAFQ